MGNKEVRNRFSKFVEKYKIEHNYESYSDAIIDIVKNEIFDFITYTNVDRFINERVTKKLEVEFKAKNMFKD